MWNIFTDIFFWQMTFEMGKDFMNQTRAAWSIDLYIYTQMYQSSL